MHPINMCSVYLCMYLFIYSFYFRKMTEKGFWLKNKTLQATTECGMFSLLRGSKKILKMGNFIIVENPIPVNIKKIFRCYWIAYCFSVNSFFPCSFCLCKTSLLWLTVRFMDRRFSEWSKTLVSYGIHACSLDLMQYSNYVTHCEN